MESFIPGCWVGMLSCLLMFGISKGCKEHSAYNRKPCDVCGYKAHWYTDVELKLCPACAGELYELKNKKIGEK